MKLVDQIKAFAASEGDDATTAAVKAVQDARALHAKLYEQGQELQRQRHDLEVQLGNVALDDRAAFDALDKQHQKLLADVRHNSAAQEAAAARLQDMQRQLHEVTNNDFLRQIEKKCRLSERQIAELAEIAANYTRTLQRAINGRRDIHALLTARGIIPPLGMALDGSALISLLETELLRLNPVGLLSSASEFRTPGAASPVLAGNAAALTPMADAIKLANMSLLDKLKATPVAPVEAKAKPEAAPDPDAELLNVPPAPKPEARLNAAEIMATMPKGKRTTLDNRSKR